MADDSNTQFTEVSTNWVYRQVITFAGTPWVLFEKVRLLQAEDKYDDPQVQGTTKMETGEMKMEPLEEAVNERTKKKLVERVNSVPDE